jgi:hypothetical protein
MFDSALIAASMSDVMTVSHELIAKLIEMYPGNFLLWKVTNKGYSDQVKKK